jgi:WD40 repeat protein
LWRLSDGALLRTIDGNNNGILSIDFSPDQQYIAAGSSDRVYMGAARVWRVSDGVMVSYFTQDPNNPISYVTSVAYSPDGSLLAYARWDQLTVVTRAGGATCTTSQPPTFPNGCPPSINVAAPFQCPYATSAKVSYLNPIASDQCPVTVACNPPSDSSFPIGTTTVTCTATDTSNNTATCSFAVNVYSACLEDDSSFGNVVLFNAVTGSFRICCNGSLLASGKGTLTANGCDLAINQTKGNRTVHISVKGSQGTGTAYLQKGQTQICGITDSQMAGDICSCP